MLIAGYILTLVMAYLLGSVPTGFLVGKARGLDIRTVGSGNIGATNVLRILGTPAGVLVLLADALKGWLSVVLARGIFPGWFHASADAQAVLWFGILGGLGAILGHNYTCWLHFKGGKGIATSAGVLLGLVPCALLIILGVFLVVFALTRYVSLASISASFSLPFATWFTLRSTTLTVVTGAMAALAIYKHKSNINRLLNGTESRIQLGRKSPAAEKNTT